MNLKISSDLSLPIDAVTSTTGIFGLRGSGKTTTAVVIVEEATKANQQVCIIDPLDVWYGISSSKDGTAEGLPFVIFGGKHQHLPLTVESAETIARFVADNHVPVIVSLRHLSVSDQRRFVGRFLSHLYQFKGEEGKQTPLLVVLDEASSFAPQSTMDKEGDAAKCLGACNTIVRRGRSSGFGFIAIDQRPASVNKDMLTQCEIIICHRVSHKLDRKALGEWVDAHDTGDVRAEFLDSLASLGTGEGWVWAPGLNVFQKVQIRDRETFDSSKTPKIGETRIDPKAFARIDVEAFRTELEKSVEESKHKDPVWMAKRIKELESRTDADNEAMILEQADALSALRNKVFLLENRNSESAQKLKDALNERDDLVMCVRKAREALTPGKDYRIELEKIHANGKSIDVHEVVKQAKAADPDFGTERVTPESQDRLRKSMGLAVVERPEGVTRPQQKILDSLGSLLALGMISPHRRLVGIFAGYAPAGGAFTNLLGTLRTQGLIDYPNSGCVSLTDEGKHIAGRTDIPISLSAYQEEWLKRLSNPHRKVLARLISEYPREMTRWQLGDDTDYAAKGGAFTNILGHLRNSMELIEYPSTGTVRASDVLFPEGLK